MRIIESLLLLITYVYFILFIVGKQKLTFRILVYTQIPLLLAHALLEGIRWQMAFVYLLSVLFLFLTFLIRRKGSSLSVKKPIYRIGQILCLLLLTISSLLTIAMPVFSLPQTTGQYAVSTMTLQLTDSSRSEIYTEDVQDKRELKVTLWYPSNESNSVKKPYINDLDLFRPAVLSRTGLPGFLLGYADCIKTWITMNAEITEQEKSYPLLLFSHGMGIPTEAYSVILSEIASHGYIIAAIEHPYSTIGTVYEDGRVTDFRTNVDKFTNTQLSELEETWVLDIDFVISELQNEIENDLSGVLSRIDFNQIGVFGHSFGGAASYLTWQSNDIVKAGINMDGSIYGAKSNDENNNKAFMMLTTQEYAASITDTKSIPEFSDLEADKRKQLDKQGVTEEQYNIMIEQITASKDAFRKVILQGGKFLSIEDTKHFNFSDIPLYSPVLSMMGMTGKIDGKRGLDIINQCILDFFDTKLKGYDSKLPQLIKEFPELDNMEQDIFLQQNEN